MKIVTNEVGKIATCSRCCSQRVLISSGRADPDDPSTVVWTVSCPDCHHNVSARTLEAAVAAWNKELSDEGQEEDWATEVALV